MCRAVMPRVSVVIPCYNQGIYLDAAVRSVLAQTAVEFEVIIVDDGSTDAHTQVVCAQYAETDARVRVLRTGNAGLGAARNAGISLARGAYIVPLDADDVLMPGYLEKAASVLDHNPPQVLSTARPNSSARRADRGSCRPTAHAGC